MKKIILILFSFKYFINLNCKLFTLLFESNYGICVFKKHIQLYKTDRAFKGCKQSLKFVVKYIKHQQNLKKRISSNVPQKSLCGCFQTYILNIKGKVRNYSVYIT